MSTESDMATSFSSITAGLVRDQEQYVDALHQLRDVHLATIDVQRAATSVLGMLAVVALPNRGVLLPTLDRSVDAVYSFVAGVVDRQYELAERVAMAAARGLANGSR
jgi:hypothetical protein